MGIASIRPEFSCCFDTMIIEGKGGLRLLILFVAARYRRLPLHRFVVNFTVFVLSLFAVITIYRVNLAWMIWRESDVNGTFRASTCAFSSVVFLPRSVLLCSVKGSC